MRKNIFVIIAISVLFQMDMYGGGIPKDVKESFTYCFNGNDSGIDSVLDINGYYDQDLFFYKNGIFVDCGLLWSDRMQDLSDRKNYNHILALEKAMDGRTKEALRDFYRYAQWGGYIIDGDIIKAQLMGKPDIISSFNGADERWYKIIDRQTIQYLGSVRLPFKGTEKEKAEAIKNSGRGFTIELIPVSPSLIPSFNKAWILKEKWFWCNENDWKLFKKDK